MTGLRLHFLATSLLAVSASIAFAAPSVIVSIKPVHSLVAGVMEGIGEPELLIDGAASPHAYSLRPSQARALERADVVFWIGHELEAFLEKPIETLGGDARVVSLSDADGLFLLPFREGGGFEDHDHAAGEARNHDVHAGHGRDDDAVDMHIWLDPENAKAMVDEIRAALADADPANAERYASNAQALQQRLAGLTTDLEARLAPVRDRPFLVFHDGYHYFENRFGLAAAGAITLNPEIMPGAERLSVIRERLEAYKNACVFAEPQFEPKIVSVVIEGTNARSAVLDPLGASIESGPDLYFTLLQQMADSFRNCLADLG